MRKTASEILRSLELRVAKLERRAGTKRNIKDYEERARKAISKMDEDADLDFESYVEQVDQLLENLADLTSKLDDLNK